MASWWRVAQLSTLGLGHSGYLGSIWTPPKWFFWCIQLLICFLNLWKHQMTWIDLGFVNRIKNFENYPRTWDFPKFVFIKEKG